MEFLQSFLRSAQNVGRGRKRPLTLALFWLVLSVASAWAQTIFFPSTEEAQQLKQDALGVLDKILHDGGESDRLSVVNALVRNGDQDAVPLLTQALLNDEAPFVRRAAAEGLARFRSENAVPALKQAALNDETPSIRWASGVALILWSLDERVMIVSLLQKSSTLAAAAVSLQDPFNVQKFPSALWHLVQSAFASAFSDRDSYNVVERAAMLKALAQMNTTSATPLLRQALNASEEDPFVRGAAAFALGILSVKEVVPDLIATLDSNLEALQLAAAGALGRLGDARAIMPLTKLLKEARVAEVRAAAATALTSFGAATVAFLGQALQTDTAPTVRQAALQSLATLGGPEATRSVLAFISSGYLQKCDPNACSNLALDTLIALAKLGQGTLAAQLVSATLNSVRDSLPFLFLFSESNLVRALSEVSRVQPELFNLLLNDPSPFVKALAVSSLSSVQSCLARDTFIRFITPKEDTFVRRAALEGLSPCATYDDITLFSQFLTDRDRRVRLAGLFALAQHGDARALIPMRSAMNAESVSARTDAAGVSLMYAGRIVKLNALLNCSSARRTPDRVLACLDR